MLLDRSGGKGGGYVSGGGTLKRNRTLPKKAMSTADVDEQVETKQKSVTLRVSTSSITSDESSVSRSMTLTVGDSSELLSMASKRWKNRTFGCFHERASPNIIFKENRGVALRKQPEGSNGFVFTQEPVRLEEKFIVGILELSEYYHVSLVINKCGFNEKHCYIFLFLRALV